MILLLSLLKCFNVTDISLAPSNSAKRTLLKCQEKMDLGSEEKSFSPCYSLGSSFLLHLWFRPLSLISHPGALELPNQGQNLSCGFIPAGPVNERAVSLEDKIRVLKRSQCYRNSDRSRTNAGTKGIPADNKGSKNWGKEVTKITSRNKKMFSLRSASYNCA